jgi:hypothetical protein
VRKNLLKPLVYLVVIAQLLLAVPAMAFSGGSSANSGSAPCDQMGMAAVSNTDHCPCCPDGANSMKDCLVSCTLAAVAPNVHGTARVSTPVLRVDAIPFAPLVSLADPPLKPPPIR